MLGKSLSHYKILEELGRGGMGIAYKAEDTKLDRTVAIKVLPSAALASEDDRARFYREAKAAAQLHHPNIAVVHEIDEAVPSDAPHGTEPSPFIAMEFIEGESLHDRIQKGPLKLEEAVRLASQIASGLEAAHEKDIVHRDIKSGNVMLTAKGEAKILDFGLAKTTQSTKLTRMGSTLGTVAYMSPEQARGEEVDHRTDIWALGVVLYEMISGKHPFPGEYEQAVVYEILNADPEPLTAVRTGVPMELERIAVKCLMKDRERRYQHADDLIADLSGVDLSSTTTTRVSTISSPATLLGGSVTQTRIDHHFIPRTRVYLFVIVTVFLTSAIWWLASKDSGVLTTIPAGPIFRYSVDLPLDRFHNIPHVSPTGRHVVYRAVIDGRAELVIVDLSEPSYRTVTLGGYDQVQGAFSPDGSQFVFAQGSFGELWTLPIDGENPSIILEVPGPIKQIWPVWLEGDRIAFTTNMDKVFLMNVGDESARVVASLDSTLDYAEIMVPTRLPDPNKIMVTLSKEGAGNDTRRKALAWVDLVSGKIEIIKEGAGHPRYADSGHLVFNEGLDNALVAQPFDLRSLSLYGLKVNLGQALSFGVSNFSQSGLFVKFREQSRDWLNRSQLKWDSELSATLVSNEEPTLSTMISDDGLFIAWMRRDEASFMEKIEIIRMDGSHVRTIAGDNPPIRYQMANDGIVYVNPRNPVNGKRLFLKYRLGGSDLPDTLSTFDDLRVFWDVSKDGAKILYSKANGSVVIRDVGTSEESVSPSIQPYDAQYSTDDRYITWIDISDGRLLKATTADGSGQWSLADSVSTHRWKSSDRIVYSVVESGKTELRELILDTTEGLAVESEGIIGRFDFLLAFAVDPVTGRILLAIGEQGEPKLDVTVNWFKYLEEVAPTGRN